MIPWLPHTVFPHMQAPAPTPTLPYSNYTRLLQEMLGDYTVRLSKRAADSLNTRMMTTFLIPLSSILKQLSNALGERVPFDAVKDGVLSVIAAEKPSLRRLCDERGARAVQDMMHASRSNASLRERVQSLISIDGVIVVLNAVYAARDGEALELDDDAKVYIGIVFETLATSFIKKLVSKL